MVRTEIKVRREIHRDRHVVQPRTRHGVFSLQYRIEVVCVPVVADEGIDRDPEVGFGGVTEGEGTGGVRVGGVEGRGEEEGLEEEGEGEGAADDIVAESGEFFVELEGDDDTEGGDPDRCVHAVVALVGVFRGLCLGAWVKRWSWWCR